VSADPAGALDLIATADLAGICRGRAVPAGAASSVGWVPANPAINAFATLADNPFGSVDYRLARYLFTKASRLEEAFRLKIIHSGGRPILMLNRDHNRELPEGETSFTADGVVYTGNFAKIALNVAHREGQPDNVLADLLRSWFGADAGRPGTVQYVELVPGEPHWHMRPASPAASRDETVS
jgi:hypothetical protein